MSKPMTLELVHLKTKNNRLETIKQLNLWGNDLDDIQIVQQMQALEVLARLGLPRLVARCRGDRPGDEPLRHLLEWATDEFLLFVKCKTVRGPWSADDFMKLKGGVVSEQFLKRLVDKSYKAFVGQPDFWK